MGAVQSELAANEIGWYVKQSIQSMGLEYELIRALRTTSVTEADRSAEAHDSFTPALAMGGLRAWPTLVVEVGMDLSMAVLRLKADWWLEQSNRAFKVVLLVKIRTARLTVTVEKSVSARQPDRPGATGTRASAAPNPGLVQSVEISRPGVGPHSAARLNPDYYVAARGELRLGFAELFLRDPGPGEHDVVFTDQTLRGVEAHAWLAGP